MTKLKYTCGSKQNARCVFYDLQLPPWSNLLEEDCVTLEETTSELYQEIVDVKEFLDFDNLEQDCVTFTFMDSENKKLSEVINSVTKELCLLKENFENQSLDSVCNISITECNLDTSCLDDTCNTGLSTIGDLLQAMINKICDLDTN